MSRSAHFAPSPRSYARMKSSPSVGRVRAGRTGSVFDTMGAALGSIKEGIDKASTKVLGTSGLSERLDAARAKVDRRQMRDERHMASGRITVEQADLPFQSGCLFVVALYALYNTLVYFASTFVPFVVAIFLMYMLDPLVRLLVKPRDVPELLLRFWHFATCQEHIPLPKSLYSDSDLEQELGELGQEHELSAPLLSKAGSNDSELGAHTASAQTASDSVKAWEASRETSISEQTQESSALPQAYRNALDAARSRLDSQMSEASELGALRSRADSESSWVEDPNLPFYRRCHCPRCAAVLVALGAAVGLIMLISLVISDQIEVLRDNIDLIYKPGLNRTERWVNAELAHFGTGPINFSDEIEHAASDLMPTVIAYAEVVLERGVVTIIFLVYLLGSPLATGTSKKSMAYDTDKSVRTYIKLKSLICVVVGAAVGSIYTVLGVDLAWIFGILTCILNFIPNVGSMIAFLLPLPVVLLDIRLDATSKICAFAIPLIIHQIVGNYIEPKVFGSSLELHPIIVLLSLTLWSIIWGVAGAILSVPLMAVLRVAVMHIDHAYARKILVVLEGNIFESSRIKAPKKRPTGMGARKRSNSNTSVPDSATEEAPQGTGAAEREEKVLATSDTRK
jgi:predicted PurR-regulated permease PerM